MTYETFDIDGYPEGRKTYGYPETTSVCGDTVFEKDQPIPHWLLRPHYSNERFWRGKKLTAFLASGSSVRRTDFGTEEVDGAHYIHSDSFAGDPRWREAYVLAQQKVGNDSSAAFFEQVLRETLQDPTIELRHIISGVNTGGNGFDYQVFGITSER